MSQPDSSDRLPLPYGMEMDISHACNLHCRFCSHYSNYGLKGKVPIAEGGPWLEAVSRRVQPKTFCLLGGEPTLNPQLCDYVWLVRDLWPDVDLSVVSNGLLLDRHPHLWETLAATGAVLEISRHSRTDPAYLARFEPAVAQAREMAERAGARVLVREGYTAFYATYQGEGPSMRPWDHGDPAASWEVCCNRFCLTVHRGRLWKCPPVAFLGMAADHFGLGAVPEWHPYLGYEGLPVEAARDDYAAFLKRNYRPEPVCAMCPTSLSAHELGDVTAMPRFP